MIESFSNAQGGGSKTAPASSTPSVDAKRSGGMIGTMTDPYRRGGHITAAKPRPSSGRKSS